MVVPASATRRGLQDFADALFDRARILSGQMTSKLLQGEGL